MGSSSMFIVWDCRCEGNTSLPYSKQREDHWELRKYFSCCVVGASVCRTASTRAAEQGLGWMQSNTQRAIHWKHSIHTQNTKLQYFVVISEVGRFWWECEKIPAREKETQDKWKSIFILCIHSKQHNAAYSALSWTTCLKGRVSAMGVCLIQKGLLGRWFVSVSTAVSVFREMFDVIHLNLGSNVVADGRQEGFYTDQGPKGSNKHQIVGSFTERKKKSTI